MAKSDVALRQTDSIFDEIDRVQHQISDRAYQLFHDRDGVPGDAVSDWLNAERELIWKPGIEVTQKDGKVEIVAALPGLHAKDVGIQVTPDDVLIKTETKHEKTTREGGTEMRKSEHCQAFESVHLAQPIDPNSAKAEYHDGKLRLTATVVKAVEPAKVAIKAA